MIHNTTAAAVITALFGSSALAAAPDNNIEWDGVSHIAWHDRRPLCPIDREAFQVRFQTFRNDLTAARVVFVDGTSTTVDAVKIASRGPYDIWSASLPASTTDTPRYYIQLIDGSDSDFYGTAGVRDGVPATAEHFALNFATLEHAPVGATPATTGVVFKVWAPQSNSAWVRGEWSNFTLTDQLTRVGEYYIGHVENARVGDEYRFFLRNRYDRVDPRARQLNPANGYTAVVADPLAYQWQVEHFEPPALEDLVIYQLHVGSFAGLNDPFGPTNNPSGYRDVADRVQHLVDLGVNAVMLNPINEFPGDFSGGYNPITKWSFESSYGTPDDFKHMVDTLHANGIAVILDIVWNHFSSSDNLLWEYEGFQTWYDDPVVDTPWGPQADFDAQGVRDYFLDSVVLLLDEFKLDGFRMDATSFMTIPPQEASGWSLMQELNALVDNRFADKHVIAEQLPDDAWITRPVSLGGAGFDAQYHDRFTDELRDVVFGSAFSSPNMFRLRDILNGSGQYLEGRQVLNYFELHDEAWSLSGGQRAVKTIDTSFPHDDEFAKSRTKLAQAFTMLAPGVPAFLMGTEWLESNEFEQARLNWGRKLVYPGIFRFYQDLMDLRVGNTALRANSPHQVTHVNDGADVISWTRFNFDGLVYMVAANFSNTNYGIYRLGVPFAGVWGEVLNSDDADYEGSGFTNAGPIQSETVGAHGFANSIVVRLPRRSIAVFQLNPSFACSPADLTTTGTSNGTPDGAVDVSDYSYYLTLWASGNAGADLTTTGTSNGTPDGAVDISDFSYYLTLWSAGCP